MRTFTQNDPRPMPNSTASAMNVEQLDGFFAALIAGPEIVMPSEYYREVFGGEMSEDLRVRQPRRGERNSGTDDAALETPSPGP